MRSLGKDFYGNEQFIGSDSLTGEVKLVTKYADAKEITDQNARLRTAGHGNGKDWKLSASIPLSLIMKWKVEEGVDAFSNDPAHRAKFKRLLNDHQYKLLRIWEGNL